MSGDPYRKALPGEKLRIPAVTWNRVLDMVSASSDLTAGQEFSYRQPNLRLYCQNNTGTGVDRWQVLAITGVTPTPSGVTGAASLQFQHSPAVIGVATTADTGGAFVVAVEPILAGNLGLVAIDGVVQVKLNVTNASDKFASPAAASRELTTSSSGQASILWKEAGTGAGKWGLVRIGSGAGGGGMKLGKITGSWMLNTTALIYEHNGDGTQTVVPTGVSGATAPATFTGMNVFSTIDASGSAAKWVMCGMIGSYWHLIAAEC
jgi:hypothetical protein